MQLKLRYPLLEQLNPGVKALAVLLSSLLLAFSYSLTVNLGSVILALMLLLLASRTEARRLLRLLLPLSIAAFGLFMTGFWFSSPESQADFAGSIGIGTVTIASLNTGLQIGSRVLAFGLLGALFALTTRPEDFVLALMQVFKLPAQFAYGTLAAFHLLPKLRREHDDCRLAVQVRGGRAHAFSGKVLLAMLINVVRWSEALAMAMISRGFDGKAERTSAHAFTAELRDWLICALLPLAVLVLLLAA